MMRRSLIGLIVIAALAASLPLSATDSRDVEKGEKVWHASSRPSADLPDTASQVLLVHLESLVASYDTTGTMLLPLPPGPRALIVHEVDVWQPDQKHIEAQAADGTWQIVEPIHARFFAGRVDGDLASDVVLGIDATKQSLIGYVVTDKRGYSLEPTYEPSIGGLVPIRATWYDVDVPAGSQPEPLPHASSTGSSDTAAENLQTRPYADAEFKSNRPTDFATRIGAAYTRIHGMFDSYTNIHYQNLAVRELGGVFSPVDCPSQGDLFAAWLGSTGKVESGVDIYTLFVWKDMTFGGLDAEGCAPADYLCTCADATSIMQASPDTGYNPGNGHDLGIILGQENGHIMGEDDHPRDRRCEHMMWNGQYWFCDQYTYNIMSDVGQYYELYVWFTNGGSYSANSEAEIELYSHPRL